MVNFKNWLLNEEDVVGQLLQSFLQLSQKPGVNYSELYNAIHRSPYNQYLSMGQAQDRNLLAPIMSALETNPQSLPQVIQQAMVSHRANYKPPRNVLGDDED